MLKYLKNHLLLSSKFSFLSAEDAHMEANELLQFLENKGMFPPGIMWDNEKDRSNKEKTGEE